MNYKRTGNRVIRLASFPHNADDLPAFREDQIALEELRHGWVQLATTYLWVDAHLRASDAEQASEPSLALGSVIASDGLATVQNRDRRNDEGWSPHYKVLFRDRRWECKAPV